MINFYTEANKILSKAKKLTENGAVAYETSGKNLVDINFKIPSYRGASEEVIVRDFLTAFADDAELALKWMFYVGDVRQGVGERRLFKTLVKHVLPKFKHLIKLIPEYSRWDIVTELFGTDAETEALALIRKQLDEDLANFKANKPISLLAKWMPSVNTSSAETVKKANFLCHALGMHPSQYRKTLSKLRAYSNVIEVKICANQWDQVNYEAVPSKANLKYKNSFLKHDEQRRREFLDKLDKGEVKINSSVAFPHEIVSKYGTCPYQEDSALEGMWKNLPSIEMTKPLIVVRDGSGSMGCHVPNSNTRAIEVATALAIYCAERNVSGYKNQFITFSARPKYVKFADNMSLADKLKVCYHEDECSNTNIQAVFDLLLHTAVNCKAKQNEIPDILIISDMEFDGHVCDNSCTQFSGSLDATLFDKVGADWKAHGLELPGVIFWNVNSRTNAFPIQQNKYGVKLMSGFSQNLLKMAMSNKLDPFDALKEQLTAERYAPVTLNP